METLSHTNRLIANLDVSGLVDFLRHQIYRAEELHRTIEEKDDLIQSLQHKLQSLEESSKTDFKQVPNLRITNHSLSQIVNQVRLEEIDGADLNLE